MATDAHGSDLTEAGMRPTFEVANVLRADCLRCAAWTPGGGRGRDSGYPLPPAQTRARATHAHGSHLGDEHARSTVARTHPRSTGVADVLWHSVQHRPNGRESPWPTAFPPCAPPTVPRPCSRTSSVLCSRSTPRCCAWRTYGSSLSPPGPPAFRPWAATGSPGSRA